MSHLTDYSKDFSIDLNHVWLNVASEGPLPKASAQALDEAIVLKSSPHLLTIPKFQHVPLELKKSIAQLINVAPEDLILGNSATYGIHLLANGLPLKAGDEIILMQNDFPSDILPWLSLQEKGIIVHQLKGAGLVLTVEEIKTAINSRTKVVCLSHIHSFSGWAIDVKAIGKLCHQYDILCIVNISQSAGAVPLNISDWPVDAVVCAGYKWLLGPYGTGFCWMKKCIRESLQYPQNYWISMMDESDFSSEGKLTLKENNTSRRYDVFGTANFFNYMPWKASIDYLLSIGLEKVLAHNKNLTDIICGGLTSKAFQLISPSKDEERTNIVVFTHENPKCNGDIYEDLKVKGIHLALWKNKLRVSPHIYNTEGDIHQFLRNL